MAFELRRFTSRDDVRNDDAACRRGRKKVHTPVRSSAHKRAHSSEHRRVHRTALRDIGQPVQLPEDSRQGGNKPGGNRSVGNKRVLARKPVR